MIIPNSTRDAIKRRIPLVMLIPPRQYFTIKRESPSSHGNTLINPGGTRKAAGAASVLSGLASDGLELRQGQLWFRADRIRTIGRDGRAGPPRENKKGRPIAPFSFSYRFNRPILPTWLYLAPGKGRSGGASAPVAPGGPSPERPGPDLLGAKLPPDRP